MTARTACTLPARGKFDFILWWSLEDKETNGTSDGNIRYYEYENDKFEFLSEYKSGDPQRGIAFLPRRGINVRDTPALGDSLMHQDTDKRNRFMRTKL